MKRLIIFTIAFFVLSCKSSPQSESITMHDAIQQADTVAFKMLLEISPQSISTRDESGNTPLMLAVENGQVLMTQQLLAAGALANDTLPNGKNALHRTDNPDLIRLLINHGADSHKKDQYGNTPLKFTLNYALRFSGLREQKNEALSAFLDAGTRFPSAGEDGRWFLHNACLVGHDALIKHLLKNDADVASKNDNGGSLLHSAAAGGVLWLAESLIAEGFAVNAINRYGQTPLFLATIEGKRAVAELLIRFDSDVVVRDLADRTPLDYAVDFARNKISDLLLLHGAAVGPKKINRQRGNYLGQAEPENTPTLFAKGIVSSVFYDHSAPNFSLDGKELYWSPVYTSRGDFIFSMKQKDDSWSAPQIESFCRVGGTYMYPTLSHDGSKMFFASDEALPGEEPGKEMNIWFVEREGNGWSDPKLVGFPGGDEYGITIAESGNLYFMGLYDRGEGSADLYRSEYHNGVYGNPVNLGPAINSSSYEDEPYIDPQERFLIFASLRPGDGRIYMSRNKDDQWQPAENISSFIPIDSDVRFPQVSRDRRYLFFASNANGNWDIYWMAIPADLK
ncbi:MAG: ankyrin repeat domain-containing protein [Calditrichia bacterium]